VVKQTEGEPLVKDKAPAIDTPKSAKAKRFGFIKENIKVPDDFDRMGEEVIASLFDIQHKFSC